MKRPRAKAPSTLPRMIGRLLLPPLPLREADAVADESVSDAAAADPDRGAVDDESVSDAAAAVVPDRAAVDNVPTEDAEGKTELKSRKDNVLDGEEKSEAPRREAASLDVTASDAEAAASDDEAAAALAAA